MTLDSNVPYSSSSLPFTLRFLPRKFFVQYAKSSISSALEGGLKKGCLIIKDKKGVNKLGSLGEKSSQNNAIKINVKNDDFWIRIYTLHDLGLAEAYMHGDFETSDLKGILDLWVDNRSTLGGIKSSYNRLWTIVSALTVRFIGQSLFRSKLNAMTGYDCSNAFFESFLSPDMTYSCALWPESTGGVRGDLEDKWSEDDLEKAQLNKIHHLLRKARVRTGDRLLEFGSGWGAMAIEAAKLGCCIDTITLSVQQKIGAEARIKAAGLDSQIRVHLMDYRNLPPEFEGAFDAFVSVEMVEAVGIKYLPQFFKIVDWALKPGRAAAVITATTQPEWRYSEYQATDYARRYQWPNSFCPSATSFISTTQAATSGSFVLSSVEDFAHHYPRTLREWARRFQANWNSKTICALLESQPELAEGNNIEVFKRKWEYMYIYAEVGYARAYTSMHFFTFLRPENILERCD